MSSVSYKRVFIALNSSLTNHQKQLDQIEFGDNPLEGFDFLKFWSELKLLLDSLTHETNKLALGFKGKPFLTANDVTDVGGRIEQRFLGILGLVMSLPKSSGKYFLIELKEALQALSSSYIAFVVALENVALGKGVQADLQPEALRTVGDVWQRIAYLDVSDMQDSKNSKLSRDNIESCLKVLEKEKELIADAQRELQEAKESAASQEDDDFDALEDEFEMTWSDKEKGLLPFGIGLSKAAVALMKKIILVLQDCKKNRRNVIKIMNSEADDITDVCDKCHDAVDDFSVILYPPVDLDQVVNNAESLAKTLLNILTILDRKVGLRQEKDLNSWAPFLKKAIEHNLAQIKSHISIEDEGVQKLNLGK